MPFGGPGASGPERREISPLRRSEKAAISPLRKAAPDTPHAAGTGEGLGQVSWLAGHYPDRPSQCAGISGSSAGLSAYSCGGSSGLSAERALPDSLLTTAGWLRHLRQGLYPPGFVQKQSGGGMIRIHIAVRNYHFRSYYGSGIFPSSRSLRPSGCCMT